MAEDTEENIVQSDSSPAYDVEALLDGDRAAFEIVHRAIERLPDNYREVVMLRDIEELSTKETAEALELSEGNVRVRLHRARQALRALLETYLEGEEI